MLQRWSSGSEAIWMCNETVTSAFPHSFRRCLFFKFRDPFSALHKVYTKRPNWFVVHVKKDEKSKTLTGVGNTSKNKNVEQSQFFFWDNSVNAICRQVLLIQYAVKFQVLVINCKTMW